MGAPTIRANYRYTPARFYAEGSDRAITLRKDGRCWLVDGIDGDFPRIFDAARADLSKAEGA